MVIVDKTFIEDLNRNLGIVHKVANIYFRDSPEREDVIQEMLYHLWKGYPSFRGDSKFSTWMYRVCLNTALTYFGKSKRIAHVALSPQHSQMGEEAVSPSNNALLWLNSAIGKLSQVNKGIILLYLEELSYEEIAEITGLSRTNISVRLVRIKKQLEKDWEQTINKV